MCLWPQKSQQAPPPTILGLWPEDPPGYCGHPWEGISKPGHKVGPSWEGPLFFFLLIPGMCLLGVVRDSMGRGTHILGRSRLEGVRSLEGVPCSLPKS